MEDFEIPVTIALAVFILAIFVTCCFYNFCSKRTTTNGRRRGRNGLRNNGKQTFKQWVKSAVHFHPMDKGYYWRDVNGSTIRSVSNSMNGGTSGGLYLKKSFTHKAFQNYPNFTKLSKSGRVRLGSGKWSLELTTINEEESSYDDTDSDMETISETNDHYDHQDILPAYFKV